MIDESVVILDLSFAVQTFLEQQDIDLYQELQQQLPSLCLKKQLDPDAPAGSKDIVTVIAVSSTLVTSLTPLIIRILDRYTPPNRSGTWVIEEVEKHYPDGTSTIHRKRVLSNREHRIITPIESPKKE